MEVVKTKKGRPAAWEGGGGLTNTGSATIVAGPDFQKLRPIYIRRAGSLACSSEHALFPLRAGCWAIHARHHRGDFVIRLEQFDGEKFAVVHEFSRGEWDITPPLEAVAAIKAAREKAVCYHCREPHYFAAD